MIRRFDGRLRRIEKPKNARTRLPFSHVPPDELAVGRMILEDAMRTGDYVTCLKRMQLETPAVYADIMDRSGEGR